MKLRFDLLAQHGIETKVHKDSLELIPNIPWSDETTTHFEHFTDSIDLSDRERDDLSDHVTEILVFSTIKSCLR